VLVLLPEEPVVAAGALDPVVEPEPLVTLPPVVEVPVVVERVPERIFTLVELRLGLTYTPVRRLLMIVVRLSGSLAITWVRVRLAYFFFFFTTTYFFFFFTIVTDDGRSSVTAICCRERVRVTTSGPERVRTEKLDPLELRVPVAA